MLKKLAIRLVAFAGAPLVLAACSGVSGVEYSTINMQPIPAERTVAVDVVAPDGETDELWLAAERKVHAKLALELEKGGSFQRVHNAGEPADYNLTVQLAELVIDRPEVGQHTGGTDGLTKAVQAVANAAEAVAAVKLPDQVREIAVYTTLADQKSGSEVVAFRAEGADGRTDATVTRIVDRIIAGVNCYGEDCA